MWNKVEKDALHPLLKIRAEDYSK